MPIIIGQSKCTICGNVIDDVNNAYSFPNFIPNSLDKAYWLNDGTAHKNCLKNEPQADAIIALAEEFWFKTAPQNRVSDLTAKSITTLENYFFLDLLSSNPENELYPYKFTTLRVDEITLWDKREQLLQTLEKVKDSGNWIELNGGKNYIDRMISLLRVS